MTESTTPAPEPTGVIAQGQFGSEIQLVRRFRAPIDDIWAAMTESERLERWIGRWEGDPRSGSIQFFMTFEGEAGPPAEYRIEECTPPHRFAGTTTLGETQWQLRFELSEADGVTTVLFAQAVVDDIGSVGPGWEYYLDRLAADVEGTKPVDAVAWADYFPTMQGYYESLRA